MCYSKLLKQTFHTLTSKKPNLSNMWVFGSECYVSYTDDKKKLDHRRIKGILLDKMVVALYTGKLSRFNFQVLQGKLPSHLISLVMIC